MRLNKYQLSARATLARRVHDYRAPSVSIGILVGVADLLRKALLVAKKLGLGEFEKWVSKELAGYETVAEIPDYREVKGQLKAFNPHQGGWIPVLFSGNPAHVEPLSRRHCGQSIAEIESFKSADGELAMPPREGSAVKVPRVGGLHHEYLRQAA